ncbi:hypothetical protein [Sphingomonas sp.]|uniref:hypothetical protein n=1 Tax=Sphingomonas sp. TaxID=28214 RepID=UPI001D7BE3C6|nr:hypothetical protein [Sphingomonas sp.]MBX9795938.1 hypothetical protein [Sphingomonas sp.]
MRLYKKPGSGVYYMDVQVPSGDGLVRKRMSCATSSHTEDLLGIRDWLGHADIKITAARYLHLLLGTTLPGREIMDAYGRAGLVPALGGFQDHVGSVEGISDCPPSGNTGAGLASGSHLTH